MSSDTVTETQLARMRAGDRNAAAEFVMRFGPRIRRRIGSEIGHAMRRLIDSQEILSTVARRLDRCVSRGRLRATSPEELRGLVIAIARNALIEKGRVYNSLRAQEGEDGPLARAMLRRLSQKEHKQDGCELELDRALRSLTDPIDREILSMWLNGMPLVRIADVVGRSAQAVRQRWQDIREDLGRLYDAGGC
jgi:DNA-directed RNA polymerase specialized sigma24 family protein